MSTRTLILDQFEEIDIEFWKNFNPKLNKNLNKFLTSNYVNIYNRVELATLNWKLDNLYNFIMASILNHNDDNILDQGKYIKSIAEEISAYDGKIRETGTQKGNFERRIGRGVEKLRNSNFIEVYRLEDFGNTEKSYPYYRLTLNGLFYVIINWYNDAFINFGSKSLLRSILDYDNDSPLLKIFLFPYFERTTLEDASYALQCNLFDYLENICNCILVFKRINSIDKDPLIEGMRPTTLFTWPSPKSERRYIYENYLQKYTTTLLQFLSRELGGDWKINSQITPNFDTDRLSIKNNLTNRVATIRINREENCVILVCDRKKYLSLVLISHGDGSISVKGKSEINEREYLENELNHTCKVKLFELLIWIALKIKGKDHSSYEILESDNKFLATIKDMIHQIDLST